MKLGEWGMIAIIVVIIIVVGVVSGIVYAITKGENNMAKRRKAKTNKYLWYGLYAVAAYYGYNWWMNRQQQTTMVSVPPGTGT